VPDADVLRLINRFLKAGVQVVDGKLVSHADRGTARRPALAGAGQRGAG
jgi:hypothetical protein